MLKSIKMAALAAAVSLTGATYSASSFAQDMEFTIGPNGVRVQGAHFCDRNPRDSRCQGYLERNGREEYRRDEYRSDEYRRDEWRQREGRFGRRCDSGDALVKARYMGIRQADVIRATERSITVRGVSRGDWVRVRFSRDGNCSVIG